MCSVCSVVKKNGIEEWVLLDDLPIDRIVHELPCALDPFVDRRRSDPLRIVLSCPREQSHVGEVFRGPCGTHGIEDGQHVDPLLHNRPRYRR